LRRVLLAVLVVAGSALAVRAVAKEKRPLRVVPSVDLGRYAGRWYEVARLPNRFEKDCAGDVTAAYTPRPDGRVDVLNRCRGQGGGWKEAKGVARVADKRGPNSKLKVRFAPGWLSFLPFVWGDYQIIELAPDYSHAVVGDPGREYLWFLARTPQLDEQTFRRLSAAAAEQGFDVSRLIRVEHAQP
jgi:apolipoprotein D and lipocalin family protein